MERHVYPSELVYEIQMRESGDPHYHPPIVEDLKREARRRGLWNLFHPQPQWGPGLTNLEYAYPRRAELVERYCVTTGRDISERELAFWHALALWKIAIIAEGIRRRAQQDSRNRASSGVPVRETVTDLVVLAHDIAKRAGI